MKCPRCDTAVLDERERQGVTVDVCGKCRGVWLDRGELEKLLAHAKRELEEERAYYESGGRSDPLDREPPSSDRQRGRLPGSPRNSAGYPDQDHRRGPYRKKSWLENFGDIFD